MSNNFVGFISTLENVEDKKVNVKIKQNEKPTEHTKMM